MKKAYPIVRWMGKLARPFLAVMMLILAIEALLSLLGVSLAVVSKNLIDSATTGKSDAAVLNAIFLAVIILVQIALQAVTAVMSTRLTESMSNSIRKKLFARLSYAAWQDLNRYHSEDILTHMTSDVGTVTSGLASTLPSIVSLAVRLAAAFVTLMYFDPMLAVLAFILGPVSVLFSRFFARKLKHLHIKIQEAESSYRAFMHESIQNMLIIKTFCLQEKSVEHVGKLQDQRLEWVLRRSRLGAASNSVLSLSYWAGYLLAFGWGALRLSVGAVGFGTLTAFLQLSGQIQGPFVALARTLPQVIASIASAGRLMEFDKLGCEESNIRTCWPEAGIVFENITFAYEPEKNILKNVSVKIPSGEIVVLCGPSGEGKTTLIRLLLSLLKPSEGQVYFTDDHGKRLMASMSSRSFISYVPQGNTLFSGTIADNLRMGDPDADEEELEAAAKAACAWDFIRELPEGMHTVIGERGLGLSEGQAQRIAIARALLRKAPVLVLDEATSALDAHTEINILQAIRNLSPARTCLIITHRPAALKICDRILYLNHGQLTEKNSRFLYQSSNAI